MTGWIEPRKPYPGAPDMHYPIMPGMICRATGDYGVPVIEYHPQPVRCSYCGNRNSKDRCDSCGAPK